jgi:hypothetical protein
VYLCFWLLRRADLNPIIAKPDLKVTIFAPTNKVRAPPTCAAERITPQGK